MSPIRVLRKISERETGTPVRRAGSVKPGAVDPLRYPAWDSLVADHPGSSFFHGSAWARVLRDTYGHTPFYLCQFGRDRLEASLPIMEVSSPLTGKRGVSLPFTDFCTPLKPAERNGRQLYDAALELGNERGWRYLECRSNDHEWSGSSPSLGFYGHVVELRHGPDALLKGFESSVRRGIRKAQLAGLRVEFSKSADAMRAFCALHARTRHRHGLPPQPHRFFESIVQHVFGQNQGFVVTARQGERPIAAAVFFHDARLAIYKFGASDERFQEFRPNNLVMWEAIKWFAGRGYGTLHLGRTSLANEGLRRFKLGFNAREERIEYYRYDFTKRAFVSAADRAEGWANSIFRCLPAPLLRLAGTLLYPHLS